MQLKDKHVIVTGSASGLGKSVAMRLANAGARVVIMDIDKERGEPLAALLNGLFVETDITQPQSVKEAFDTIEEKLQSHAQILVNCAGIGPAGKVANSEDVLKPLAHFKKVVDINLLGSFNVLSMFVSKFKLDEPHVDEERGVIINTSSVAAYEGQIGQSAYAASKAGVAGMTLPLARELARSKIRVMAIAPGIFKTPLLESFPLNVQESLGQQVPFPSRLGHPEEFAQLVEAIIQNPMLNGEVIRLDGAMRMAAK